MYSIKTGNDYSVYMHVFPNDKVYIGITSQNNPEDRWIGGFGYKVQPRMWRAIQKYGWENVEHYIIARHVNIETAVNMEKDLIELYDATNKMCGYNASPGGWAMGEESRKKLSEKCKGRKLSEEIRAKISKSLMGKKPSEKSIARLREYNRTRDYSKMVQPNETPILQYDILSLRCIGEFKSINRAAAKYGLDPRNIKCCADEHVAQYRGYLWIYKDKATIDYIIQRLYNAQNPPHSYPILMEDKETGAIEYFKSQVECYKAYGFDQRKLSYAVLKGRPLNNRYWFYRASIPDYIEATGKPFYENVEA